MIKQLETLLEKEGEPLKEDAIIDFGEYDVSIGAEMTFYMRNPNENIWADLKDLRTAKNNFQIYGPDFLVPGETGEFKLSIPPRQTFEVNFDSPNLEDIPDLPLPGDRIIGKVKWKRIER